MISLLYSMPGVEALTSSIAAGLRCKIGGVEFRQFPDGESYVRVERADEVKGADVAIVSAMDRPDARAMPLWFLADAVREFGAASVGLICPYLPYMRQDARFEPGEALTSRSFATMMCRHIDWLVTVDPHLHRLKSLDLIYTIPSVIVSSAGEIGAWIAAHVDNPLIIGPDEESAQWAIAVAASARAPHAVLTKRRSGDRTVEIDADALAAIPDGCTPVLVDDIISTAATMIEAVRAVQAHGLGPPVCVGVHAVFAGSAFDDLTRAGVREIATCNTIPHPSNRIDLAGAIAAAVRHLEPVHAAA